MVASQKTWKDYIWLLWFVVQTLVIVGIDMVDKYPDWLVGRDDSPLHFLLVFRENYIKDYNDPIMQWQPIAGRSWIELFFWVEFTFLLPVAAYAIYRLSGRSGTTGALELLLLIQSFETALTTFVCIYDVQYWDPKVYSPAQKNMFRYQLLGPWFAIPSLLFVDMYSRLLKRISAVDVVKKTQ